MSELRTCEVCGVNVAPATTAYTELGEVACRACVNRIAVAAQERRAEETQREIEAGRSGTLGLVESVLSNDYVDEVSFDYAGVMDMARVSKATSFTCLPCKQTLPVTDALLSSEHRLLCHPCHRDDQERREAEAAAAAAKRKRMIRGVVVAALVIVVLIIWAAI